jgi:methyl-accepting chemotaxis protein
MASETERALTSQQILDALTAYKNGDLAARLPEGLTGTNGEIARTFNALVAQTSQFHEETGAVVSLIGTEGRLGAQAEVPGASGVWKERVEGINAMSRNLTEQIRDVAEVTRAVARGDFTKKIINDSQGEMRQLTDRINAMVDGLNHFASEVTRLNREIGTEGRFGGQAEVAGVEGTWKDLVANINRMAANLTDQLRDMSNVSRAALQGDLSRKTSCRADGETR